MNLRDFYFRLDLRSLGLFRILAACVLMHDWLLRWRDLEPFYSAFGVLPTDAGLNPPHVVYHFCLLDAVGSLTALRLVFLGGLVCYVCFLLGLATRVFAVLTFVFYASLLNRYGFLINEGGDHLLKMLLLWSLFLPLGARFSLDARRRPSAPGNLSQPSLAALVIVLQIILCYVVGAINKHGEHWRDGTAVYYALHITYWGTARGAWLADHMSVSGLRLLTWGALALEYSTPVLILCPWGQPWPRRGLIVSLLLFHLMIFCTTDLGEFPFVMCSSYALLLRPEDWGGEAAAAYAGWRPWVDSVVAWLFFCTLVADYNNNLAHVWRTPAWRPSVVQATVDGLGLWERWHMYAKPPRFDPGINVAAPGTGNNYWWVIVGQTQAGRQVDLLTGLPPNFDQPSDFAGRHDRLWRKYLVSITMENSGEKYLPYFAEYLVRKSMRDNPPEDWLRALDIYAMKQTVLPPGSPPPFPVERVLLLHYDVKGGAAAYP